MIRRWLFTLTALLSLAGLCFLIERLSSNAPADAPASRTPLPELGSENTRLLAQYPPFAEDEAAILLLRPGQPSLAAVRAFQAAGIPFGITSELGEALKRPFVFIPCDDHSIHPAVQELAALRDYVFQGGRLVLQVPADLMTPLTGVAAERPRRTRKELGFRPYADDGFDWLDEPEERKVPIGSKRARLGIWTHGLLPAPGSGAAAVASFPDTLENAVLRRTLGRGSVYTLGVDLKDMILRPQSGRQFSEDRPRNAFSPSADVWPLVLRGWYERAVPVHARLRGLPGTAKGLLVLTHNAGWGASLETMRAFLAVEKSRKVRAGWFVQTKYLSDVLPGPMLNTQLRELIAEIAASGNELASHGVVHSPDLEKLPLGIGGDTQSSYRPSLGREGRTNGGNLLAELGLSRRLLQEAAPKARIEGFRAPFLPYPDLLDEALERIGYVYDSSLSSRKTLTYFPFFLLRGRGMEIQTPVLELPMAWEDENTPEAPASAKEILALLKKTAANEAPFVCLLHPSKAPDRSKVLSDILDGLPAGFELRTPAELVRFWKARGLARFSIKSTGPKEAVLRIQAPAGRYELSWGFADEVKACPSSPGSKVRCSGRTLSLEDSDGWPVTVLLVWK
ncbi:MAG: polysaccharide deacetylase family protein [Elusimicrobiota bacterium]|jgi:hypothetical protein